MTMASLAPRWAPAVVAALLAVIALSYAELPWWGLAGALLAPVAAVLLAPRLPVVALAVCAAASMATAPALDDSVPVWTVALSAALFIAAFLAGRRLTRVRPAAVVFAAGVLAGGTLALVEDFDREPYHDDDHHHDSWDSHSSEFRGYFIAQPDISLHVNATRWLRFTATGGYRFATAAHDFGYDATSMSGAVVGGKIEFGWF